MQILITFEVEQLLEESNALLGPSLPSFDPICMFEIGSEASYGQWKDDDSSVRFSSQQGISFQTRRVQLFVAFIPTPWTIEMNLFGFPVAIYHPRTFQPVVALRSRFVDLGWKREQEETVGEKQITGVNERQKSIRSVLSRETWNICETVYLGVGILIQSFISFSLLQYHLDC